MSAADSSLDEHYCISRSAIKQASSVLLDPSWSSIVRLTVTLTFMLAAHRAAHSFVHLYYSFAFSPRPSRLRQPLIQTVTAGRAAATTRRPRTSPSDDYVQCSRLARRKHTSQPNHRGRTCCERWSGELLRASGTRTRYFQPASGA